MKHDSIETTGIKKLLFLVVGWALVASLINSSTQNDTILAEVEKDLLHYAVMIELDAHSAATDSLIKTTLISSRGEIVKSPYGEVPQGEIFDSLECQKALRGDIVTTYTVKDNTEIMNIYMPRKINGELGVLLVSRAYEDHYFSYFINNFLKNLLIALGLTLIITKLTLRPFSDSMRQMHKDLYAIRREDFNEKSSVDDSEEMIANYVELNRLGRYFKNTLGGLRHDLTQWEKFFSTIPRGLLAIDSSRNILSCNTNALELLSDEQHSPKKCRGESMMKIFRNADLNHYATEFLDSGEQMVEYEFEYIKNNIVETMKLICVKLIVEEKEVKHGAMILMENVTALRSLETMRTNFVANVSHELKTPITIINGYIETLKDCMDDPANVERFINVIGRNSERMSTIVTDLLSLSKLEYGQKTMRDDFVKGELSASLKAAVNSCTLEADAKSIAFKVNMEKCEPIKANHGLLEQAFRNLIENAIRYSPEDTKIQISLKKVKNSLRVSIKDEGPGIAPEHIDKIFERFYRVDKSRDRQTGGTGLGLAIVKHIVHNHGGEIKLESTLGAGCQFYIDLPLPL